MDGVDLQAKDRWVAVAVGLALHRLDLVVGAFAQAGGDARVVPDEQAGADTQWIKRLDKTPRAYEVYGELRAAMRKASDDAEEPGDEAASEAEEAPASEAEPEQAASEPAKQRGEPRPVGERISECGTESTVLERRHYGTQTVYRFRGSVACRPAALALNHAFGNLRTLDVRHAARELSNGTQVIDVAVPLGRKDGKQAFEDLERAIRSLRLRDTDAGEPEGGCDVPS